MSGDEQTGRHADSAQTARTVGQLVKYSRELNRSQTVEEVGTYALEATFHVMDGHPTPTVLEVHQGDLRVLESMSPQFGPGDGPTELERRAYETGRTVVSAEDGVEVAYTTDEMEVLDGTAHTQGRVAIAASSVYGSGMEGPDVVLSVRWDALNGVEQHHVKPLSYMADHVATAVNNIRSRERLERARNDLATRKEMVELYDSLLRHDLGNDLQVITGYSGTLVSSMSEDDQRSEYAEKIHRTAKSASDLVDRVGELVKTIETEGEPEARDLGPVLTETVEEVDAKFESLTVAFDPEEFDYRAFAGDLLDSVFGNVLSNAAVHNDGPVTVRVYAEEPGPDTVVVGFADDGTGIPEEVREDIFELGTKGPDSEGSGLGLGFVRALTQSYGGAVELRESDRGGADFRVRLDRV
jgi:signal transduction histidine kinase